MREIMFRGKRVDNGEWAYGDLAFKKDGTPCIRFWTKLGIFTARAVIPETVGQYTGLTDKNGTKIFEGDIVLFNVDERGVVYYDNEETSFMMEYGNCIVQMGYCFCSRDLEVIGNIHDNPEFLKQETDNEM